MKPIGKQRQMAEDMPVMLSKLPASQLEYNDTPGSLCPNASNASAKMAKLVIMQIFQYNLRQFKCNEPTRIMETNNKKPTHKTPPTAYHLGRTASSINASVTIKMAQKVDRDQIEIIDFSIICIARLTPKGRVLPHVRFKAISGFLIFLLPIDDALVVADLQGIVVWKRWSNHAKEVLPSCRHAIVLLHMAFAVSQRDVDVLHVTPGSDLNRVGEARTFGCDFGFSGV